MTKSGTNDLQTQETIETVLRFNEAFNRHDVDAIMALMQRIVSSRIRRLLQTGDVLGCSLMTSTGNVELQLLNHEFLIGDNRLHHITN